MKVTIERSKLLKTLAHVQSVVERRNTIPILSNVMLAADGGRLVMTATDLDLQINDSVDADVDQKGSTTVPAQTLLDIVKKLPEGSQVRLESASGRMSVAAGRSRFQIPELPTEDFPNLPRGDMQHSFTLSTKTLEAALQRTRFAISTEETRYYLNGVFMHVVDGRLIGAATDGHRLSQTVIDAGDESLAGMPNVIVPRKTVGELVKLVAEYDGEVEIGLSPAKISFDIGHLSITSKVIDGTFPDYTRVIPRTNEIVVKADVKALIEATDRVSAIASEKTRAVRMRVEDNVITVSVSSPENGTATDEVACESSGKVDIGFNSRYLLDVLGYVSAEQVEIRFGDAASPVLILDAARGDDAMVIMPMRV